MDPYAPCWRSATKFIPFPSWFHGSFTEPTKDPGKKRGTAISFGVRASDHEVHQGVSALESAESSRRVDLARLQTDYRVPRSCAPAVAGAGDMQLDLHVLSLCQLQLDLHTIIHV